MRFLVLFVSATLVASVCGLSWWNRDSKPVHRQKRWIVNGEEADEGDWPFMVNLHNASHNQLCAGTLLSRSVVMTVAHCFRFKPTVDRMTVSDYNVAENETNDHHSMIKKKITFPNGTAGESVDIILLVLETPIPQFDAKHMSVLLPFKDILKLQVLAETHEKIDLDDMEDCLSMGWGHSNEDSATLDKPDILEQVDLPKPLAYTDCIDLPPTDGSIFDPTTITVDEICTNDPDDHRSGCQDDGGGPMMCKSDDHDYDFQVGIIDYGDTNCFVGEAVIASYTSINYYLDIIIQLLRDEHEDLWADFWNSIQHYYCAEGEMCLFECTLPTDHEDRETVEEMGIDCGVGSTTQSTTTGGWK